MSADLDRAAEIVAGAGRIAVFSGAGISAESGVPTFRDAVHGLWENHSIEEVATPEAVRRNPRLVWEFYEGRRKNMLSVEPNPGHLAIAEMEGEFPEVVTITQNIDGLHQRAGSRRVLEVHGSLWKAHCDSCGAARDPFPYPAPEIPPPCDCGSVLRPSVVLFGEVLPEDVFEEAAHFASGCDVCLVVGTSGAVWPAAGIPLVARDAGHPTIEINPEPTELSRELDLTVRGPSGEILPRLLARVRELRA
jgi:NAD-dependent deacetylase